MEWKVVIVGPDGTAYKDTSAFQLLYSFPAKQQAEEHADGLRAVAVKVALSEEGSVAPRNLIGWSDSAKSVNVNRNVAIGASQGQNATF